MTKSLFWFRRDLRLDDNPALAAATSRDRPVFAVWCRSQLTGLNERQVRFVLAAVNALRTQLAAHSATLSVLDGEPASALCAAAMRLGASAVFCARALDPRECDVEKRVEAALQASGIRLVRIGCDAVFEPESIAALKQAPGAGYRVFPPFYQAWRSLTIPPGVPAAVPDGADDNPGVLEVPTSQPGMPEATEAAALRALERFVTARAADYGTNAEYPARNATSRLGPYLRFGLVSPRALARAVQERMNRSWTLEQERISMDAFLRRLAWRDFYLHLAFWLPRTVDEPLQDAMRGFYGSCDERRLAAWQAGMTGYPFVDAAMRQLRTEGYVHQRAAIVAASFCVADLGLDWKAGRDHFLREMLEADPALCSGNWQRLAGVGSDQAAYPRIYNPLRQAILFDPQGGYVRRYCPELARLPTALIFAPWEIERQRQTELGFFTPQSYPRPIVDHSTAAGAFLRAYQEFRRKAMPGQGQRGST
jgi:deoxyribodipyrimidine photo-lyase